MSVNPIKLHLGCGTNKLPGWVNIDSVAACRPDLVHDITTPLPYADQSADEILAEDLLEHFDKYIRFVVFGEWVRVLKVGGTVTVQVPNFISGISAITSGVIRKNRSKNLFPYLELSRLK